MLKLACESSQATIWPTMILRRWLLQLACFDFREIAGARFDALEQYP